MSRLPILIDLYRGGVAIVFGVLLLFIPDKSRVVLFNLMGFFWLSIGLAVIRRDRDDERYIGKWIAWVAGLAGIVTGLLVVTRRFTRQWMGEEVLVTLLGLVVLMTGLLHVFSEIRLGVTKDTRTGIHFLLGLFEVLLGVLLLFSPQTNHPFLYWVATIWALLYGGLFIGSAVYHYIQGRRNKPEGEVLVW
jgi:uncharacterized membrane protein HdeD (DUF308 family)